ncbi:unnamed protein product [Mucor hiemalis]
MNKTLFTLLFLICFYRRNKSLYPKQRVGGNYHTNSASLHKPKDSGMFKVLETRNEGSYIVHFGLTPDAFDLLHGIFEEKYPERCKTGRPRSFDTRMVLALVLTWLRGTMKQETLCVLFGATAATISRAKRLGLSTLSQVFTDNKYDERWKICWPTVEEMGNFNKMILSNSQNNSEDE